MEDSNIQEKSLKELARNALVRSVDGVSDDKKIIQKIEGKVIFIQETNKINIVYKTDNLQKKIGLYLIAKFVGHKILNFFDKSTAGSLEISTNLNLSIKALAPSLGVLSKEFIEKENEEYKIKAYKILEFLDNLEEVQEERKGGTRKKISNNNNNNNNQIPPEKKLVLREDGFNELSSIIDIEEKNLKKLFFVRENDIKILDNKFLNNGTPKQHQLEASLTYLLLYKYFFGIEDVPSDLLRKKLKIMGVKSLSNLTTNLHNFQEFIFHEAGKRGSTKNNFILTEPGEDRIKEILKKYIANWETTENE